MKILSLLFVLWLSACSHLTSYQRPQGHSILQGLTTENTVEFSILLEKGGPGKFTVISPQGETLAPEKTVTVEQDYSTWAVHKVKFSNLAYSKEGFQLVVEDHQGKRDQRTFHLFSNQGDTLRFAVGSCANAKLRKEQKGIWRALADSHPEWLFLIGDNFYVESSGPEAKTAQEIWDHYVEGRLVEDLYFWKELVPTYAVWDDNDYGQNNGNKTYALKEQSTNIFKAFFAQGLGADYYAPGPGVAGRLDLRGMHFTFLDNRSFRDADAQGEHFGAEQEAWLFEDLKKSQLPTWIISGDQFFGGYHKFESYEGSHPRAFEAFLNKLKEVSTPFVFVSGDRHLAELMQFPRALLGQLSFEFTTSPLHSTLYPAGDNPLPNPWRVILRDDAMNFMQIDTTLAEASWNIGMQMKGSEGPLFARDLSLTTEALKDFTIEKRQKRRRYRRARWRRR